MNTSPSRRRFTALLEQISVLEKKAQSLQGAQRDTVIEKIVYQMDEYGITLEDLERAVSPQGQWRTKPPPVVRARKAASIKYRDPETGLTWTGQGRAPNWITAAEAAGQKRDDFLLPVTQLFGIEVKAAPPRKESLDMSALSRALQEIDSKS
ncbi:H-NS family nucleoid-associated regulatory protein [Pigmentiphaga aceris]|uniref:H-NS histone family protein n=1 Tax=Pigmentiphaga aceris TaxID=1940612 RepID=UPI0016521DBE|nr:H-NS histone family protein [Pigmentiphaga aceris]